MQERPYRPDEPAPAPPPPPPGNGAATLAWSRPTNTLAVVSLAAGVASFVILPVLGAVVAAITGHMARREIRRTGEGGGSLALAGIILGYVHLALFLIGIVLLILFVVGVFAAVFSQR